MSSDQDILIEQRIDAPIEVYDEVNGDELKLEIRRLKRHVSSAREKNQEDIYKWGFQESLPNLTIVLRMFLIPCVLCCKLWKELLEVEAGPPRNIAYYIFY